MRITFGTKYNQMNYYQNAMQKKLNQTNTQIASGLKIQYGYQDSSVFNQNLKLDYEELGLSQGIDNANTAYTRTLNTDKALSELSQTMVQFKTKLIQAANDIHSPTSREAIAKDLEKLRDHMINVANTSIGGEFIFSGSNVKIRPFTPHGEYKGNDEILQTLISSQNLMQYNITGNELFFSRDSDWHKSVSTNIRKLNQSKLNPDIMDRIRRGDVPEEVYIKATDRLRDLIGDDDRNPSNNGKEYFYMRGVRPDGESFKAKFALDVGFIDEKNASSVQDLLDKIGKEFGNTSQTKVVDVTLNAWGQIEIKNLIAGNSKLEFHLISSDKDVENVDELAQIGARVNSFQKSPFLGTFSQDSIASVRDNYDYRLHKIPTTFLTKNNEVAARATKMRDVIADGVKEIVFSGTRPNTDDGKINQEPIEDLHISIDDNLEIRDVIKLVNEHFGGNLEGEITNGEIVFRDNNVRNKDNDMRNPPFNGESGFSLRLSTYNELGEAMIGLRSDYTAEYDRLAFEHRGTKLVSNVSQVLNNGMGFATDETKLSEVAGGSVDGQVYNLKLSDHNGVKVDAKIELSNEKGSFLILQHNNEQIAIPLYNPHDEPPVVSITKADELTYRQLMDAISVALNYSNIDPKLYQQAGATKRGNPTQEAKWAYESLLQSTKGKLEINLNRQGKIEIDDKMRSVTRMDFMIYNQNSNDFSESALRHDTTFLVFNANNAVTIDEPDLNFFEGVDDMIDAVRKGIYRPNPFDREYSSDMRNLGIQNSIERFYHYSDHIEKMVALNGAHGRAFENAIHRNEVLRMQIAGIKNDNIGTDIAQTYNHFANLTNNYNAVLNSTSRINQMSLVNFL